MRRPVILIRLLCHGITMGVTHSEFSQSGWSESIKHATITCMKDLPINLETEGYGLAVPSDPSEPRYPVLHYSGPEDLDLPQDGTMTVKYHVKREVSEVDRKTGKHHYDCDIEILSIEKIKGEDP